MEILYIYLIVINIVAFVVFGLDKFKAKFGYWRIKENVLLLLSLMGGFLGAMLGMKIFSHKTIKSSFQIRFQLVVILWIIFILLWMIFLSK